MVNSGRFTIGSLLFSTIRADLHTFTQSACIFSRLFIMERKCRWKLVSQGSLEQHQIKVKAGALGPILWNAVMINPRISCLGWRLLHRRTPTQDWAKSIGVHLASRCILCCREEESDLHVFFTCYFASNIWNWLIATSGSSSSGLSP